MPSLSRRAALGTAAASLLATRVQGRGTATALRSSGPSMSLAEFRELNGEDALPALLGQLHCGSLTSCHKEMREEHGIWIPELVPIFERLDAMASGTPPENDADSD